MFILILLIVSCNKKKPVFPFEDITMESFAALQSKDYAINDKRIRNYIDSFRLSTRDTDYVDILTNSYYAERKPYLWINRGGTDIKADLVLQWLDSAKLSGIPQERLFIKKIEDALKNTRSLNFTKDNTASRNFAVLEYYLTKGYIRYAKGQRFGFVDAKKVFNQLDKEDLGNGKSNYRILYSANYDTFDKTFFERSLGNIHTFAIDSFLSNIQPNSDLYKQFCKAYQSKSIDKEQRNTLACNIERARWRTQQNSKAKQGIEVNLPSGHLVAKNANDEKLSMKICFGSFNTKTPILNSEITHLEINPYWIVPTSIVRKDIARHAQDSDYFARKHFEIIDHSTGEIVSPDEVTEEMFLHGHYTVRQQKGQYNSLGRMIFRFPNEHAIYLHDTNEKYAFSRTKRSVSHGCIRLEKPLELALFYLDNSNEKLIYNLRYSIQANPYEEEKAGSKNAEHLIHRIDFTPKIPIRIMYYTCMPNEEKGNMNYYSDIYNYDPILLKKLKL